MWPFKRSTPRDAVRADDVFWLRRDARVRGMAEHAAGMMASGAHALLLAYSDETIRALIEELTKRSIDAQHVSGAVEQQPMSSRLESSPTPVCIVLRADLVRNRGVNDDHRPALHRMLDVSIAERFPIPSGDDHVLAFVRGLTSGARIVFHVSADDDMIRAFSGDRMSMLLMKLGLGPDESISHPMLSKSIRRAQRTIERECVDASRVRGWLKDRVASRGGSSPGPG